MTGPTTLNCPSCNAPLATPVGQSEFFCQFCGARVRLPSTTSSHPGDASREPKRPPGIPEKLMVSQGGHELTISWRWFQPAGLMLVPFCIAWNAFLLGWYSMAFSADGPPGPMRLIMLVFPIGHLAIGLGLAYACLVLLFNRTRIRVDRNRLQIQHGPIPAGSARTINAREIEQLYVKHSPGSHNGKLSYPVVVRLKTGHEIQLMKRNGEAEIARAVEHLVESHLGLQDTRMPHELDG